MKKNIYELINAVNVKIETDPMGEDNENTPVTLRSKITTTGTFSSFLKEVASLESKEEQNKKIEKAIRVYQENTANYLEKY